MRNFEEYLAVNRFKSILNIAAVNQLNNNFCNFIAIEMSHYRVSSYINSMSLGKAILLRAATKTDKTTGKFWYCWLC